MMEKIFEIEEKYPDINNLQVNGISIWPYYRTTLRFGLIRNAAIREFANRMGKKGKYSKALRWCYYRAALLGRIITEIPNFKKWFSTYDYIIFSNSLERKMLAKKPIDKLATGIIDKLDQKKVLLINYPSTTKEKDGHIEHKYVLDGSFINQFARLFITSRVFPDLSKDAYVEKIQRDYDLYDIGMNDIHYFFQKNKVLTFFLKKWKPKCVFTNCYTYYSEVFTSKRLNIKTVEIQHGVISPLHPGYESKLKLNRAFTTDYLWAFGKNSIRDISNNIINRENVSVIGNYYIEELGKQPLSQEVLKVIAPFSKSICIPTDYITEEHILKFILNVATNLKDVGFFVIPRVSLSENLQQQLKNFENIIVIKEFSFQEFVRHCTFHTATNSTCCLEALSLGVRNILINDDNEAYSFYSALVDSKFTKFVSTTEEYISLVKKWDDINKEEIIDSNKNNFAAGYKSAIANALKQISLAKKTEEC